MKTSAIFACVTFLCLLVALEAPVMQSVSAQAAPLPRVHVVAVQETSVSEAFSACIQWLVDHQCDEGYWSPDFYDRDTKRNGDREEGSPNYFAGRGGYRDGGTPAFGVGVTALAATVLADASDEGESHPFRLQLQRSSEWLIKRQTKSGRISGEFGAYMGFNHALATLALAKHYAVDRQPEVHRALTQAGRLIQLSQQESGGWSGDFEHVTASVDVTAWMLMAVHALRQAEILKRDLESVENSAVNFLRDGVDDAGLVENVNDEQSDDATYRFQMLPQVMTGGALLATKNARGGEALMIRLAESWQSRLQDHNYPAGAMRLYWATEAATRMTEKVREDWGTFVTKRLLSGVRGNPTVGDRNRDSQTQRLHGSVDPAYDRSKRYHAPWATDGGRVMATALTAMALSRLQQTTGEDPATVVIAGSENDPAVAAQNVEWPSEIFSSADACVDELWELMLKEQRDFASLQLPVHGRRPNGSYGELGKVGLREIIRVKDFESMAKSDTGEIAVDMLFTLTNGSTQRIVLRPKTGEEYLEGDTFEWVSRNESARKARGASIDDELCGVGDPRLPWYQISFDWFEMIPVRTRKIQHFAGLAIWRSARYSHHPAVPENDPGNEFWLGASSDVLYEAENENVMTKRQIRQTLAFIHKDKTLIDDESVIFWVDSYLDPAQRKRRMDLYEDRSSALVVAMDSIWMEYLKNGQEGAIFGAIRRDKRIERRRARWKRMRELASRAKAN